MRYQIRHGIVKYAADTILEDVNFEIRDREKIAVVGRNGCGKTTLLKLIAGELEMANADSDEECGISMSGKQTIGYQKQISYDDGQISVEDEILKVFADVLKEQQRMHELSREMERRTAAGEKVDALMQEYARAQIAFEAGGGYTCHNDALMMFQKFGFPPEDIKRPIGQFSGGQQTRIAFIKLLLSKPDIMLLDEPTNHLDLPTIEWLEEYLRDYPGAVVVVSHDRMFLDHVTTVTYEIEYHRMKRYAANYSGFVAMKDAQTAQQEKEYEAQQKEIARLQEWIDKWKNTPSKVSAAHSKQMAIEHMVRIEKPRRYDLNAFHAAFTPRLESHKEVLKCSRLGIGYDELLSTVSFTLNRAERLAIIGENGKGKSTLLKTIVGEIPALSGSVTFGGNTEWVYFDQQTALAERENPTMTVIDDFWEVYPDLNRNEVRSALGNFLFSGDDVFKQLGQLSGGEKVRLELCKLFKRKPNFLILDEPTNHMDIVGKQALEWMLKNYAGTVLYVSHDRYFIKETATQILEFDRGGVHFYAYPYETYLEEKRRFDEGIARRAEAPAPAPAEKKPVQSPTLEDVFDKKTYYNPGKIESRRKQAIAKYERQLEESEQRLNDLKLQLVDPAIATDYVKLQEIQEAIEKEEHLEDNLLEWLTELETEGSEAWMNGSI